MHIESIKKMMECLSIKANAELENGIENIDANEMGEVIDMIKDLAEAKYYCKITESMEEAKEEEETLKKLGVDTSMIASRYYNDYRYKNGRYAPTPMTEPIYNGRRGYVMPYYPDEYDPANEFYMNKWRFGTKPRYYDGGGAMNGSNGNSSGVSNSGNGMRGYDDGYRREIYPIMSESNYDRARRGYTESKMTHSGNTTEDKTAKLQSLEEYAKELTSDITEMIRDASPEEKSMLKSRIATLASKIS